MVCYNPAPNAHNLSCLGMVSPVLLPQLLHPDHLLPCLNLPCLRTLAHSADGAVTAPSASVPFCHLYRVKSYPWSPGMISWHSPLPTVSPYLAILSSALRIYVTWPTYICMIVPPVLASLLVVMLPGVPQEP